MPSFISQINVPRHTLKKPTIKLADLFFTYILIDFKPMMKTKTPRVIKERVIRQWLQGYTRERIRRENGISAGIVSAIIEEAGAQKEYNNIDFLRQTSLMLKEEGLELSFLGFAIRLKKIMEENGINEEDQLETILSDFATYCFKNNLSYETLIASGSQALNLSHKFGIRVEKIPEYIVQGKNIIDRLEAKRRELLGEILEERQELDTIVSELDKYETEKPLIERIKDLERELKEAKRSEGNCKRLIELSESRLHDEMRAALRLDKNVGELNVKLIECQDKLEERQDELDELKIKTGNR
jgi:hypothetical protein